MFLVLTMKDGRRGSKSQTDYVNTKKYIMEIIDYHDSIVSIDVNDVRDLFQEGGIIHIFSFNDA